MNRDVSSLLRIDFEAALAKLAWAQLQGAWEIPAELARLAIAAGAGAVAIDVAPNRLVLRARGARVERRTVSNFASMLDPELEPEDRHRAMVELEGAQAFVLSAIACSSIKSAVLRIGGDQGMKLEMRAGAELSVVNPGTVGEDPTDLHLEIEGLPLDADKAVRWLSRAGRFAALPVTVNGRRIDLGFKEPLITGRADAVCRRQLVFGAESGQPSPELPALIAISSRGSAPRLWLLRHGIIATRATIPGHPAFEAAIEMAPGIRDGGRPSPADLRERLGPYLHSILDSAARLIIRLGGDADPMPEPTRARVARLLLEAVRKRLRVAEGSGVRIFTLFHARGRELVSIDEIARRVRVESGGVCTLDAISPDQDPEDFVVPERGVLVLSESERALLGEHLCAVFDTPPARLRPSLSRRLLGRLADGAPILRLRRGEPVAESALSASERRFLSRLRAALASAAEGDASAVVFFTGDGAAFRNRDGIVLPRSNPTVRHAVRVVERDSTWLYPAMVSLLEGSRYQGLG
ncbi:MAG: hypothetical protein V3T72_04570 [Thermoanaerobaculia bacterium]